jgi:antitoxin (DNA-binding transcriptional repressor) of toxin-antitoxin stability system
MSNLISTSFYDNPLPLAIKAKKANEETIIKAGTPIATIIPISLTALNNTVINIVAYQDPDRKRQQANIAYGEAAQVINTSGDWTDWYREAVDEKGNSLGSHEVKTLKLSVVDNSGIK